MVVSLPSKKYSISMNSLFFFSIFSYCPFFIALSFLQVNKWNMIRKKKKQYFKKVPTCILSIAWSDAVG